MVIIVRAKLAAQFGLRRPDAPEEWAASSVDGAVLMSKRVEIIGYGGEISGSLPPVRVVRHALDLEGDRAVEESTEDVGTRHRSAYRLAALARSLDPAVGMPEEEIRLASGAAMQMGEYLAHLVEARRARPSGDLLSDLVAGEDPDGRMDEVELLSTLALLLVAGHETTVNLVSNGPLALLRHPGVLDRLRRGPGLVVPLVEEVLRFDPPKQFRTRTTLAGIEVAGVTIPKGATVVLLLASGNHDPSRFPEAERLVADREDNQHLSFGGGAHYCVGAPLARVEGHIALNAIARRLLSPRLVTDPPLYRHNASLRGPEHLLVRFDRLAD